MSTGEKATEALNENQIRVAYRVLYGHHRYHRSVGYATIQIRRARDETQVQHLLTLENEWKAEPMWTYRRMCAQKRLAGVQEPDEEVELLNFFETVALLANHGNLKDADVWETLSYDTFPLSFPIRGAD
jgi:hypothetical protein